MSSSAGAEFTGAPAPGYGNAVPRAVERSLAQPRFEDLINESSSVNNNALLTLFRLVIAKGTHKLKPGNSVSKQGWIALYNTAFENNFSSRCQIR
jgi:hypothetical protein